jgi:hypothetical protein
MSWYLRPTYKTKTRKTTTKRKTLGTMSVLELVKVLDHEFSIFTRLSNSHNGFCTCITCNKLEHWKDIDAGHYISRAVNTTRWDERNVKPQCKKCNRFMEGAKHLFRMALVCLYGAKEVENLEFLSQVRTKLDRQWLVEKIKFYREKNKKWQL